MSMGFAILKLLTLWQYAPFADVRLWRYRIGNAFFGTAQARFTGSGREVYKPFLVSFVTLLAVMLIAFGIAWQLEGQRTAGAAELLQIGRAHVLTPVNNAQLVCRLLFEKKQNYTEYLHLY